MVQKMKTGLCVLALLLALLAAYTQELAYRSLPNSGTAVRPAPFAVVQVR